MGVISGFVIRRSWRGTGAGRGPLPCSGSSFCFLWLLQPASWGLAWCCSVSAVHSGGQSLSILAAWAQWPPCPGPPDTDTACFSLCPRGVWLLWCALPPTWAALCPGALHLCGHRALQALHYPWCQTSAFLLTIYNSLVPWRVAAACLAALAQPWSRQPRERSPSCELQPHLSMKSEPQSWEGDPLPSLSFPGYFLLVQGIL